jgi:hypothetical protein
MAKCGEPETSFYLGFSTASIHGQMKAFFQHGRRALKRWSHVGAFARICTCWGIPTFSLPALAHRENRPEKLDWSGDSSQ